MAERRCPDCDVALEPGELAALDHTLITEEEHEGVLGAAGLTRRHELEVVYCPECGLVRLFADLEE